MITRGRDVPIIINIFDWALFLAQLTLIVHILYQLRLILGPAYYAARAEELILLLAIFCFLTAASMFISLLAKSYMDEPRYRGISSEEVA